MNADENLYDDFSSFLPSSDDYNLDDLDEILDSSIDLTSFGVLPSPEPPSFEIPLQNCYPQNPEPISEYNPNLNTFSSPAVTSLYTDPVNDDDPQRTSNTSDEDNNFNPDDFINFLTDDDFKMEQLSPADSGHDGLSHHRGTPSPTSSCSSSIGSGTSGIQSDVSSVSSSQGLPAEVDVKQEALVDDRTEFESMDTSAFFSMDGSSVPSLDISTTQVQQHDQAPPAPFALPKATPPAVLPITLPVLSLQSGSTPPVVAAVAPPIIQARPQVQAANFSVLQGTLIPVKTVPITSVTSIKTPTPIKVEPKLAPKITKSSLTSATTTTPIISAKPPTAAGNTTKTPTNSKPKTIFLSSNDFQALMQKLKTNGSKSTKINGNINGQMPKIVMKTANGQVINSAKVATTQFVPKTTILKSAGTPLIIKQKQSSNPAAAATSKSTLCPNSTTLRSSTPPNINIYKGIVDEKTMKKQQRMIKNRESASLSRKKKKEYVVSLESRINDLEKENITLKGENGSLRSQLVAFAQTCHCKHNNISDFILNSLSISATNDAITYINEQQQHVRIAPKPSAQKSIKQRMMSTSVKRNVAVLFAMAFMVTLNVGGFQSYLRHDDIETSALEIAAAGTEENAVANAAVPHVTTGGGRRRALLWAESETEFNDAKLNRSRRDVDLEVPPLHFLRPSRRVTEPREEDTLPSSSKIKCPMSSNQTETQRLAENQRLASNLNKWIDGNDYLNLSTTNARFGQGNHMGFKLKPDYFDLKKYDLPLQRPPAGLQPPSAGTKDPQKRTHHYFQRAELHDDEPSRKNAKLNTASSANSNSLDLFKPKISDEYMRLFKSIKRQADTFYVLSFNLDHILLPASAYNKSSRPKMSLLLPAGDPTLDGDVLLMQIDCEVVNTTELQLKSEMIPEKLRPTKFAANANDVANNETRTPNATYSRNKTPMAPDETDKDSLNRTTTTTKPPTSFVVRRNKDPATFYKVQRLVRPLNDPVVVKAKGKVDSQVPRNATLFQRMRETVHYLP